MQNFQKETLSGKKGFYAANYALSLVYIWHKMLNAYKIRNIIESFSGSTPFQIKLPQPIKPHYSDQHPNSPKQVLRSVMVHF